MIKLYWQRINENKLEISIGDDYDGYETGEGIITIYFNKDIGHGLTEIELSVYSNSWFILAENQKVWKNLRILAMNKRKFCIDELIEMLESSGVIEYKECFFGNSLDQSFSEERRHK